MDNDLISRQTFKEECLKAGFFPAQIAAVLKRTPAVNAVEVKHGRCDMCSIGATGTGSIGLYGHGWQVCIRKQGWTYDLVINHCGEQIAIPIDYCPNCGAKMDGERKENETD